MDEDGKVFEKAEINDLPGPQDRIQEGDILILVGAENDIQNMALDKKA